MGDIDGDSVLDRLPPSALAPVVINVTDAPPTPYLSWRVVVNDGNLRFRLVPEGNMWIQMGLYILLWILPLVTAAVSAWIFIASFYRVKFNKIGVSEKMNLLPVAIRKPFDRESGIFSMLAKTPDEKCLQMDPKPVDIREQSEENTRTVLIATMEYDIEDWNIKIKIGG